MNGLNLKSMTVDDLLALRERISETLSSRVEAERRDLESRLARLRRVETDGPQRFARGGRVIGKRAEVAPKYRNPDNPFETWSGRGRQPRWLSAALKTERQKLRDFEIVEGEAKKKVARNRRNVKSARARYSGR
ncbi:MAG: H-NS histone family protein [Gammaproteobacteria bacterium]